MCQRQDLEHSARHYLFDDVVIRHASEGVEDCLPPRGHLVSLVTGQVAQILAPHSIERPEHHDLLVELAFHDRLKTCA